jgi:hypothetical protein
VIVAQDLFPTRAPLKWSTGEFNLYNAQSLWLWGQDYTPGKTALPDYASRIRAPQPGGAAHLVAEGVTTTSPYKIRVDGADWLGSKGPGRFVTLANSNLVQFFFEGLLSNGSKGLDEVLKKIPNKLNPADGSYRFTADDVLSAIGIPKPSFNDPSIPKGSLPISFYQYMVPQGATPDGGSGSGETYEEYVARAFVGGAEDYHIAPGMTFVIYKDGTKALENATIFRSNDDYNFDSEGAGLVGDLLGRVGFRTSLPAFGRELDQSRLARDYDIEFVGGGRSIGLYTEADFRADSGKAWVP